MMRHSTLELTGRYTRPRGVDIEAATSLLASLKLSGDQPDARAAAGTDSGSAHCIISEVGGAPAKDPGKTGPERLPISNRFAHYLPTAWAAWGRLASLADVMAGSDVLALMEGKTLEKQGPDASERVLPRPDGRVPKVGLEPTPPCGDRILSPMPEKGQKGKNKPNSSGEQSLAPSLIHDNCQTDSDLAAVIDAWGRLPEAVRAGIVAMVKAATGGGP
ncbi:MAG TPA: hypothetical protein VFF52_21345 [Isosphaeraceae bacterium]|nr:hypothetical protein [Isosphaeraceae bacterium]